MSAFGRNTLIVIEHLKAPLSGALAALQTQATDISNKLLLANDMDQKFPKEKEKGCRNVL